MKKLLLILLLLAITSLASAQINERYLVNSKTLNMRSGAGKEFEIIATLSMRDEVTVLDKNDNGWWLVDYDGTEGYVFSKILIIDPYFGWDQKSYESGETPECENVDPQYDTKLDNFLRINVNTTTDVVVKLMKKNENDDICIRIVYIRSNETFSIINVPEGKYYLKIAYGTDWRQSIVDNKCYGKFMENSNYEIGKQVLDFNLIKKYNGYTVPSFQLSLSVVVKKGTKSTFVSNKISEAKFNE